MCPAQTDWGRLTSTGWIFFLVAVSLFKICLVYWRIFHITYTLLGTSWWKHYTHTKHTHSHTHTHALTHTPTAYPNMCPLHARISDVIRLIWDIVFAAETLRPWKAALLLTPIAMSTRKQPVECTNSFKFLWLQKVWVQGNPRERKAKTN